MKSTSQKKPLLRFLKEENAYDKFRNIFPNVSDRTHWGYIDDYENISSLLFAFLSQQGTFIQDAFWRNVFFDSMTWGDNYNPI